MMMGARASATEQREEQPQNQTPQQPTQQTAQTTTTGIMGEWDRERKGIVSFLCGWGERTGSRTLMYRLCVPFHVARIIVEWVMGFVRVYEGGTWNTIGKGVAVVGDVITWVNVKGGSCGSTVGGRIAWLEPSLQEVAGLCGKVYWAFHIVRHTGGACQEGVGAASSLRELGSLAKYIGSGGFYPVTCDTLNKAANLISFGFSTSNDEPKVNGLTLAEDYKTEESPVSESDEISFLLEFTPDKRRGLVRVFRNLELLTTFTDVDTSVPIFPTVNMCCCDAQFKFVRNPKLPHVLIS
ncbi:hypothetical protein Pelo_8351 [Pelomyxa schiedti]|nr:hypothetical protein Pelo_8351 [Pelomyxa schiedti]